MGTLDGVLAETSKQFVMSDTKTTSLLSGLLAMINETPGGLRAFVDSLNKAGLSEFVSTWLGKGNPRPISSLSLEAAIGRDSIEKIAERARLPYSTTASALAFMVPKLVIRLAPGGIIPTQFNPEIMAYANTPVGAMAAGTRQAAYATERAVRKVGVPAWLWPVLVLLAVFVLAYWLWSSRQPAKHAARNTSVQLRISAQIPDSPPAVL
jgi:uncharacterized protein YidB (DUF937 family)